MLCTETKDLNPRFGLNMNMGPVKFKTFVASSIVTFPYLPRPCRLQAYVPPLCDAVEGCVNWWTERFDKAPSTKTR
jgi:hypothetical protein